MKRKDTVKSSNAKETVIEESWRSEIEDLALNDERWTCVIGMMVETRLEHGIYIELFNEAAEEETREAIFSLSYAKLIRGTKLLGKSDPRQGICHFASKQIEDGGEESMGPWLLCRLIKFFVNRAKVKNLEISQSRLRIEEDVTKEMEILGATGTPAKTNTVAKSKRAAGDAKSSDKQNTKLRKRGEEWKDRIHIDDAPIDGPSIYVVLTGFYDPTLPTELLKAGLPLTAIFKVLSPGKEPEADHPRARDFWSSFEATLKDPRSAPRYNQVIFQSFCPPEISESSLESEVEGLKSDAYRRISFLMYDLADIMRSHANYIREMKIQANIDEVRPKFQLTETYESIMSLVPEECASVPIVLDAMLSQVEGFKVHIDMKEKPETTENGFRSKINDLNEKYDPFDANRAESDSRDLDPRFIVHGDDFGGKNHHCSWKNAVPEDFGVRVLRRSAIFSLWSKAPTLTCEQEEMYAYHIELISDCFDAKTDGLTMRHYLHLLLLDKMVNGKVRRGDPQEREDLEKRVSFPRLDMNDKHVKSETILCHKSLAKNSPHSFRSDSAMEYGKEISETFECPELFALIDTRKMLGYTHNASPHTFSDPNARNLDPEDFDSVQLLSADVFSQVFFECTQEFDYFETRYFAPTDSVLVVFENNRSKDNISEHEYAASIRTPVGLRDFSRFVIEEEREWIEKEEETHSRKLVEEESRRKANAKKPGDSSSPSDFYTDADFVLPKSIKGLEIRKQESHQSLINRTETSQLSRGRLPTQVKGTRKVKEVKETNSAKAKISKRKSREINPGRKSEERLETTDTLPPLKIMANVPSIEDQEPPAFLGYDVADRRVQVSGLTSEFRSDDGTVVKANLEEWAYAEPRLEIIVELLGNSLAMHNGGDDDPTFRFTTANGIAVGFYRTTKSEETDVHAANPGSFIINRNYQGSKMGHEGDNKDGSSTAEMAVDPGFRVSWASGLVVEILPGDGTSDPFYMKQSYLSKGPECADVSTETQRVYLRDGTIIVFHNDESVLLLRPNGCVVNCTGFSDEDKSPEGNRFRSTVLEPDGNRYDIFDGEIIQELGQELVRTSSDYEVGERFTRRSDGTNILINSEGYLAVCFPDGSRITTGYVINEHPVYCEWTEEELQRFYPDGNERTESRENVLREDGFVSVLLTCCMEHKNYATVTYDQSKSDCTLSMPGDVGVHISSDTFFSVTVGTATSLKVNKNEIVFTGRTGTSPEESSASVYNLGRSSRPSVIDTPFLQTTDSFGNVFTVDLDGKTSYNAFGGKSGPMEEDRENNPSLPNSKSYRFFAVKRDLSAYEHVHRLDREAQETEPTASIFYRQVPHQKNQKLCTTLTTLNPITASRAWLQPYRVPNIRPTNEDRKDLLRSTYSIPWDYLIPYGKNGIGIHDRTWNSPLNAEGPNSSPPEALLARTTQTIKNREDNAIVELQTALGRYWGKAINDFRKYRCSVPRKSAATVEEREFDDWLNDFALGRRRTFDRRLYFSGLAENRLDQISECQISGIKNSESDDKIAAEEIEWYKSCLRNRTVLPYFSDIPGACFLWVLERVNEMGKTSEEEVRKKLNE